MRFFGASGSSSPGEDVFLWVGVRSNTHKDHEYDRPEPDLPTAKFPNPFEELVYWVIRQLRVHIFQRFFEQPQYCLTSQLVVIRRVDQHCTQERFDNIGECLGNV